MVFFRDAEITEAEQKVLVQALGVHGGKPASSGLHVHPLTLVDKDKDEEISVISNKYVAHPHVVHVTRHWSDSIDSSFPTSLPVKTVQSVTAATASSSGTATLHSKTSLQTMRLCRSASSPRAGVATPCGLRRTKPTTGCRLLIRPCSRV